MSRSVTVRNVPDDVVNELASRAAASGRSLQEFLRGELVDLAARTDMKAWVEQVSRRTRATGTTLTIEQILEARDADRR
jgi:plasmid stability protein